MLAGSHRNAWPDETGTGGRTNRNTHDLAKAVFGRFSLYVLVNIFIPPDNHDFASSRRCSFILNQAK